VIKGEAVNIEYIGKDTPLAECELLAMRVDGFHRPNESDLIRSRWFDYSDLHPTQATYLYAHYYKEQTRVFCETYIDSRTAADQRAFAPNDIFRSRDMTSMWLARGQADKHGIPYPFVLWFAQERAYNRTYKTFPRPNQLYGEEFEIDLIEAWRENGTHALRYSKRGKFKASNFIKTTIQKQHVRHVITQIKTRPQPHINLLARMISEDVLSENQALVQEAFTPEELAKAVRGAEHLR
jgi:hypothetical protein